MEELKKEIKSLSQKEPAFAKAPRFHRAIYSLKLEG
jgi:hypothetical protein